MTDLVLLTVAIVAVVRKAEPRIDGLWVIAASTFIAALVAVITFAPDWPSVARNAGIIALGAIGGTAAIQKLIDRGKNQ